MLNALYYKNSNFIDEYREYDPSYNWSWSSICVAKFLLLKWRVENGISIKVRKDAWIPGEGVISILHPLSKNVAYMRVSDLINFKNGVWNTELVSVFRKYKS